MDTSLYLQAVLVLAIIVGLILLTAALLRRFGGPGALSGLRSGRRPRRLNVVETLALDARRRLVLVRHDDREHLLLLGPGDDMVVEAGRPVPRFEPVAPLPSSDEEPA